MLNKTGQAVCECGAIMAPVHVGGKLVHYACYCGKRWHPSSLALVDGKPAPSRKHK